MKKFIFSVITMFAVAAVVTSCGNKASENTVGEGTEVIEVVENCDSIAIDSVPCDSTVSTEVAE